MKKLIIILAFFLIAPSTLAEKKKEHEEVCVVRQYADNGRLLFEAYGYKRPYLEDSCIVLLEGKMAFPYIIPINKLTVCGSHVAYFCTTETDKVD